METTMNQARAERTAASARLAEAKAAHEALQARLNEAEGDVRRLTATVAELDPDDAAALSTVASARSTALARAEALTARVATAKSAVDDAHRALNAAERSAEAEELRELEDRHRALAQELDAAAAAAREKLAPKVRQVLDAIARANVLDPKTPAHRHKPWSSCAPGNELSVGAARLAFVAGGQSRWCPVCANRMIEPGGPRFSCIICGFTQ